MVAGVCIFVKEMLHLCWRKKRQHVKEIHHGIFNGTTKATIWCKRCVDSTNQVSWWELLLNYESPSPPHSNTVRQHCYLTLQYRLSYMRMCCFKVTKCDYLSKQYWLIVNNTTLRRHRKIIIFELDNWAQNDKTLWAKGTWWRTYWSNQSQ